MEAPKCEECGQLMRGIAVLAGDAVPIGEIDTDGLWKPIGVRSPKLYQCPEDKTIAVD